MQTDLAIFGTYDTETKNLSGFSSSVGWNAYEHRMLYYYVREYLDLRNASATGNWRIHPRYLRDLALVSAGLSVLQGGRSNDVCLVELGSSVLPSRAFKVDLFSRATRLPLDLRHVRFVGIEKSALFRSLSSVLADRYRIEQHGVTSDLPEVEARSVFFTHFVGEHAFATAEDYAEALTRHDLAIVAEVFRPSPNPKEFGASGLDFFAFHTACRKRGMRLCLLDCYPDYNPYSAKGAIPVVRAKLIVTMPDRNGPLVEHLRRALAPVGLTSFLDTMVEGEAADAAFAAASAQDEAKWRNIRDAKLLKPSWDRADPEALGLADDLSKQDGLSQIISISHPQIDWRIRELLQNELA